MVQRQEVVRERFYLGHLEAPDVDSYRSCVTQSIGFLLSFPAGIRTEQLWRGFRRLRWSASRAAPAAWSTHPIAPSLLARLFVILSGCLLAVAGKKRAVIRFGAFAKRMH
jgi:hypothetical protein